MMTHGDKEEGRKIVEEIWRNAKPHKDRYTAEDTLEACSQNPLNHYAERSIYGILD